MRDVTMNELTEEIIKAGARKKRVQTTAQLPAYRAASNVLYVLTEVVAHSPRKTTRFSDRILADAADVLKSIALANEVRGEERIYWLGMAMANAQVIDTYAIVLNKTGVMSGERLKTLRQLIKSLKAQVAGWRESTNR